MIEQTLKNIKVRVSSIYEPNMSSPNQSLYVFSYKITIENKSQSRAQLLRRKWKIIDYHSIYPIQRNVEGEGVVGEKPIIEPNESYVYTSYCKLSSSIGEMSGYYTFFDFTEYKEFQVEISQFSLQTYWMLN